MVTRFTLDGEGNLTVEQAGDAEDLADWASHLRDQPQRGDWHHCWTLDNVMVADFYNKYNAGRVETKPMDDEFWQWVHKQMKDPQYRKFWTHDPANQFRSGYNGTGNLH